MQYSPHQLHREAPRAPSFASPEARAVRGAAEALARDAGASYAARPEGEAARPGRTWFMWLVLGPLQNFQRMKKANGAGRLWLSCHAQAGVGENKKRNFNAIV